MAVGLPGEAALSGHTRGVVLCQLLEVDPMVPTFQIIVSWHCLHEDGSVCRAHVVPPINRLVTYLANYARVRDSAF